MPGFEIFGDEERREVQDVLETGVLFRYGFDTSRNGGWKARTFERELASRTGAAHALLCASGTAALSIALAACRVGAGDEVIIPPFTFVATMEAVIHAGAVPVFADIDETLCLDPAGVEAAVTPRTRAVIPVHMCGAMARIDDIRSLCDRRDLVLIEDACQAVGGSYRGKALGTFGHMGCFSFDSVKTITCGEGGAVLTDDEALYARADAYSDHGHDHAGADRGAEGHPILGNNHRISELNAAVGLAQFRKLDRILETQRAAKKALKAGLSDCTRIRFRELPDSEGDSATFLSFFLPDEESARNTVKDLSEAGGDGCFYWYDNNWHYLRRWDHLKQMRGAARLPVELIPNPPDYRNIRMDRSDAVMSRVVSMLIKLSWSDREIAERAERMRKVLRG